MRSVEIFEWKFTPANYLEQEIAVTVDGHSMTVVDGVARAEVDSEAYASNPDVRQRLHDALNASLLGVQLVTHQPYELSKSSRVQEREDGSRGFFIECEPGNCVATWGTADLRVTGPDGEAIVDTRRDRLDKKKKLAERIVQYRSRDATLAAMIESQSRAVRDPGNELVHLFEIAEALETKFGKRKRAHDTVGVTGGDWKRFWDICNERELRQGRHRGQSLGSLRDATDAELKEARDIGRRMIEGYITYLEEHGRAAAAAGAIP